jgi:hypothetical protein
VLFDKYELSQLGRSIPLLGDPWEAVDEMLGRFPYLCRMPVSKLKDEIWMRLRKEYEEAEALRKQAAEERTT